MATLISSSEAITACRTKVGECSLIDFKILLAALRLTGELLLEATVNG